jgi:uncharacterized membrane protein
MTRIAATEERVFRVQAPVQQLYDFFTTPEQLRELIEGVDGHEALGKGRVRWVLKEKVDKGIRFKADYTVMYEGNGRDHVWWRFVEGNMGNAGDAWLTATTDGGTKVRYREMVEPDLPLTPLLARLIKPIVERELRGELGHFLERVQDRFGRA